MAACLGRSSRRPSRQSHSRQSTRASSWAHLRPRRASATRSNSSSVTRTLRRCCTTTCTAPATAKSKSSGPSSAEASFSKSSSKVESSWGEPPDTMAVQTKDALVGARPAEQPASGFVPRRVPGRDWAAAWLFLAPCMLVLVGLIAYPFFSAIVLSFEAKLVGSPATWVGLDNYVQLLTGRDLSEEFYQALRVTVGFTVVAIAAKLVLGMCMALLLNEPFAGRSAVRAFFFLPWAVPTLIAGLTWKWMYDGSQVGLLNMLVIRFGLSQDLVQWLGNYNLALWAVVVAVVWTSTPFFSMMLLAGLQAIPGELYEAAKIDGAGVFGRFRHVTLPSLTNVIVITTLLSSIWTAT